MLSELARHLLTRCGIVIVNENPHMPDLSPLYDEFNSSVLGEYLAFLREYLERNTMGMFTVQQIPLEQFPSYPVKTLALYFAVIPAGSWRGQPTPGTRCYYLAPYSNGFAMAIA